jgi:hypothetical protein
MMLSRSSQRGAAQIATELVLQIHHLLGAGAVIMAKGALRSQVSCIVDAMGKLGHAIDP